MHEIVKEGAMPTDLLSQFAEEFQELISRYKNALTNAQLMNTMQKITRTELGFRNRLCDPKELNNKFIEYMRSVVDNRPNHLQTEQDFKNAWKSEKEVRDVVYKNHCTSQAITEAGCDGDIRHCKSSCNKLSKKLEGDWVVSDKEPL